AQTRALAEHSRELVTQLRAEIGVPERPCGRAALVMFMGFPGVGKTHCARLLAGRLGAAHVATDHLRSRLFIAASYADEENRAVFGIAEALVDELLSEGHAVILDATNLVARYRAPMERVAVRHGIQMLHVLVVADDDEVRARLAARALGRADGDHSDADVAVYERMRTGGFEAPEKFVELRNGPDLAGEIERIARNLS
ncbi:MAG: AAA family ATPase, partial [Candidatus Limnocylindria bacterium]